ncbi:hypothetical protein F5876DRAFT_71080 [Lentinula aff. lateritia]|uniref:Uncharacterized protein n=1 Tax=Lentinula aff. lateritia TaxID=2804960 RepID=A0ACC1TGK6_9AGAR|nr:hypothetical protein F5876DRAFT_71080 [Lentinula aff. lateritia]
MSADQSRASPRTPSPLLPPLTALGQVPSPDPESDGELEQDQLAFTLESPSRPQLQLFETVFNTGKPLSAYCQDNPLWLLLAEVASPCTNCSKAPGKCKVLPNSPRCTNCSAKKTCSLGKILRYRYFTRRCSQDLAYSRRFLELHRTPAHKSTWGIPLGVWREYDAALHARTSSTSTLLELNMLDELDTANADQHELQKFLALQQGEAAIAAQPGPSSKNIQSGAHKKRSRRKSPVAAVTPDSPLRIRLVVPPGRSVVASPSVPAPPRASLSQMEVPPRDLPMQGPSDLARLAAVAEAHSGLVQPAVSSPPVPSPIKGAGQDLLSSNMPPTPRPTLRLAARVRSLESQLADLQGENSSLTSALRNTSHALESQQREVEQLRSSNREVREHEVEYRRVLEQFSALDEALPGDPGRSLLEHFQKVQEDLLDATRERKIAVEKLSTSTRRNSHLTTSLLYQQGVVDESNALATHQRRLVEELQEEVHRARSRAAFVDQMIKEYPDEGYYEVVLPPLSQLEGDLNKAREDLRRVATFAHRLYRSDPATVLHHHYRYLGAIIEAVVAFLRRGLESDDLNVAVHNFRLALDYMQAARGVHGDMYLRSLSSIQWFFNKAVNEDEGLYRMVLEHSRFDNDGPFLTAAQHAGFAPPPDSSLEPPLHQRMFALSTALPHSDGAGRWDDIVPALPSIDQLTADWEQLMLQYLHHIIDTPLSGPDPPVPMSSMGSVPESSGEVNVEQSLEAPIAQVSSPSAGSHPSVPLFLPEQESPTSPSPPRSPDLPPLFGSVASLSIDLTGDDDELYETEEVHAGRVTVAREVTELAVGQSVVKEESL